jgi:heat shock protein HtpX
MTFFGVKQVPRTWESVPELTVARSFFAQIAAQAELGSFDPGLLESLLQHLARELQAAHRAQDLGRALQRASATLAELDEYAAQVRERERFNYKPYTTIAQVIAKRAEMPEVERVAAAQSSALAAELVEKVAARYQSSRAAPAVQTTARPPVDKQPAYPSVRVPRALRTTTRRSVAVEKGSLACDAWNPNVSLAQGVASAFAIRSIADATASLADGMRSAFGIPHAAESGSRSVPVADAQPPEPTLEPQHLALDGARLHKSVFPTWVALVALSWVSLIWGGLISAPFGVGALVLGSAVGGIIAVPLWATIFGFMGMSRAMASTLREVGFECCGPEDPLTRAGSRFAEALGIRAPAIGTMKMCNAFAMGTDRNDATVAMGRPLMEMLTEAETEAVLAHELGHIVSGDMKRMMLMRTFQNATVWFMMQQRFKQFARWVICWAAELYILAFSRSREYWADAMGAALTSKEAMIGALRKLEQGPPLTEEENTHARFMVRGRVKDAFSTHPSWEERIAALEAET